MKTNVLRKIDYYLGPVVCKCLLAARMLLGRNPSQENGPYVRQCSNILIIKFFGMGTILFFSPALRELKRAWPQAKISIATLSSNRELCAMLHAIDSVLCLDISGPGRFLKSFYVLLRRIRKERFDIVIDLEFLTNFSALVSLLTTLLSRPTVTVGFNAPFKWRNDIYHLNVAFDHSRHITKIFAKLVSSLTGEKFEPGFEPERQALLAQADTRYAQELLRTHYELEKADLVVCVNINAGELNFNRRWPKEYFSVVIEKLLTHYRAAVILIGGAQDRAYVEELKKMLPASPLLVNIAGATTLKQLIGVFMRSSLLLTNDSGPLHLAEVMGLPTVSFFGPETPYLYGPVDGGHYVFYEDLYCSPCLNIYNSKLSHCKNNVCLKAIQPEAVLRVLEQQYL
ncbi:MAG TPA: glycosyltransferase family 9 protein [Patescibacteria group bacterium]|nr:glycosyltransferase family 9 protein [Patescibacteria group bacterium]